MIWDVHFNCGTPIIKYAAVTSPFMKWLACIIKHIGNVMQYVWKLYTFTKISAHHEITQYVIIYASFLIMILIMHLYIWHIHKETPHLYQMMSVYHQMIWTHTYKFQTILWCWVFIITYLGLGACTAWIPSSHEQRISSNDICTSSNTQLWSTRDGTNGLSHWPLPGNNANSRMDLT